MATWKVTIDRVYRGQIERIATDKVVSTFPWSGRLGMPRGDDESEAIDLALGRDVTMEPGGTSYVCTAVRV